MGENGAEGDAVEFPLDAEVAGPLLELQELGQEVELGVDVPHPLGVHQDEVGTRTFFLDGRVEFVVGQETVEEEGVLAW